VVCDAVYYGKKLRRFGETCCRHFDDRLLCCEVQGTVVRNKGTNLSEDAAASIFREDYYLLVYKRSIF
jgi:hypothetical protein